MKKIYVLPIENGGLLGKTYKRHTHYHAKYNYLRIEKFV